MQLVTGFHLATGESKGQLSIMIFLVVTPYCLVGDY